MEGSFVASAPGKIILFGEHAVVGGEPAVATCLSLRTWCRVRPEAQGSRVSLELLSFASEGSSDPHPSVSWDCAVLEHFAKENGLEAGVVPPTLPSAALAQLAEKGRQSSSSSSPGLPVQHSGGVAAFLLLYFITGKPNRSLHAAVWSTLPVGAGLGSSAAYSASVCGSLAKASGLVCDKETLNAWTFQAERVLHGNPSGIDNSVAIFGGCLMYSKAGGISVLQRTPVLPLLLVDTRVPRSTQKLVAGVLQRREAFPSVMSPVIGAIGHISRTAVDLFGRADIPRDQLLEQLNTLIDMNQGLLECIGVSHPSIRQVVNATLPCDLFFAVFFFFLCSLFSKSHLQTTQN
jgi:mevalonate kinase